MCSALGRRVIVIVIAELLAQLPKSMNPLTPLKIKAIELIFKQIAEFKGLANYKMRRVKNHLQQSKKEITDTTILSLSDTKYRETVTN